MLRNNRGSIVFAILYPFILLAAFLLTLVQVFIFEPLDRWLEDTEYIRQIDWDDYNPDYTEPEKIYYDYASGEWKYRG